MWTGAEYRRDAATIGIPTMDLWLMFMGNRPGGVGLDDFEIVVVGEVAGDAFGETILYK